MAGSGRKQPGYVKDAIRVFQLKIPVVAMYSAVNQKVQSSLGSTCVKLASPQAFRVSPKESSVCDPAPATTVISGPMVLAASAALREVNPIDGKTVVLERLYPRAMLPAWSIATLPIQRKLPVSGAKVDCCATTGVPFGFCISYQRTPLPGAASVPT